MPRIINAKTLRKDLGRILERVRRGERFTVVYRSHAVCDLVPPGADVAGLGSPDEDVLYRAKALGRSTDGRKAADHDATLYGA